MKKYVFIFSIFLQLFFSLAIAQQKVTFAVEKIELAKDTLKTLSYQQSLEFLFGRKIEAFPAEKKNVRLIPIASNGGNAFIETLHTAYYEHRPLVFSPDMIWLLICQGFSIHINQNSKKFQNQISKHTSKKKITILKQEFEKGKDNDWSSVFNQFTDSIRANTKDNIADLMIAKFSTTTQVETIAYQVTLMETMKKYFDFDFSTGCGIHSITIEGTPEDWQILKEKTLALRKYDLEIWVDGLLPILDEFILASQNKPNPSFWANIYKHTIRPYSPSCVSGWIIKFFPYLEYSEEVGGTVRGFYEPNYVIKKEKYYYYSTLTTDDFPHGIIDYSFNWKDLQLKKTYSMAANAGFIGCTQDKITKALRPEIGWLIRDKKAPKKNISYTKHYVTMTTYDQASKQGVYWLPTDSKNPIKKPIFRPDSCKTLQQSKAALAAYIKQEVEKQKAITFAETGEKLEGIVKLNFIITWEGNVIEITLTQKPNKLAGEKAIEIVKNMPPWKPAKDKEGDGMLGDSEFLKLLYKVNYKQNLVIDFGK